MGRGTCSHARGTKLRRWTQPSALSLQPSSLNPKPETLNPQPQTLIPVLVNMRALGSGDRREAGTHDEQLAPSCQADAEIGVSGFRFRV